jgi:ankyrin repeat protein
MTSSLDYWDPIQIQDVDRIAALARAGSPLNDTDGSDQLAPLHYAADIPAARSAQALVDAGADIEIRDKVGSTPLFHAVLSSRRDEGATVLVLLGAGADPWAANVFGLNPWYRVGDLASASDELLEAFRTATQPVRDSWHRDASDPLVSAATDGDAGSVFDAVGSAGVDVRDDAGRTAPLLLVLRSLRPFEREGLPEIDVDGAATVIRAARAAGASVLAAADDGATPLGVAENLRAPKPILDALRGDA